MLYWLPYYYVHAEVEISAFVSDMLATPLIFTSFHFRFIVLRLRRLCVVESVHSMTVARFEVAAYAGGFFRLQ